jgi:hypothetical protein
MTIKIVGLSKKDENYTGKTQLYKRAKGKKKVDTKFLCWNLGSIK